MSTPMNELVECYSVHAPLFKDDQVAYISEPQAMRSGAGWYVGQWCIIAFVDKDFDEDSMYVSPYARCSEYFATEQEAISYAHWLNADSDQLGVGIGAEFA